MNMGGGGVATPGRESRRPCQGVEVPAPVREPGGESGPPPTNKET